MKYKGYGARVDYDADDRVFVGHVAGIKEVVGFHGTSVAELEKAFHEAVDDYLAACRKLQQKPEHPVSGRMMLRVPPELHAQAIRAAELSGQSLNQWATDTLRQAV